jgi:hypothetical protein
MADKVSRACKAYRVNLVLKVLLGWLALSVLVGLLAGKVIKVGRGSEEPPEPWEPLVPPARPDLQDLPDLPEHLATRVYLANQGPRVIPDHLAARVRRDHRGR